MTHDKIVVSGEDKPNAWPEAWEFPGTSSPPGWPKKIHESCELAIIAVTGFHIAVEVLDEYSESSDRLDGEYIQLEASANGVNVRCKQPGSDVWGNAALAQISDCNAMFQIDFDWPAAGDSDMILTASVFGAEPDLATTQEY